ncbi:MAG TPA: class I SAM-dependent methyltransferase [Phycisphaerales bacterium]|nr:class I SAM-dependent methyltransferase [Phycisphaerales bacterium]
MDSHERITQRYQGRQGRAYHEVKRGIPDVALPWVAASRAAQLAHFVTPRDAVLEYGVGSGWNLAVLPCGRKLGYDVHRGLRPVLERQGIEFVEDLNTVADGSIDVVLCRHVLEHTPDPLAVLSRILRLLREGGRLVLIVPYEFGRRGRRFDPDEPNHHVYAWNVQTLGNLVTDAGFLVQRAGLGRYGYDRFAAAWAVRLRAGRIGFGVIRRLGQCLVPLREVRLLAVKPGRGS